MMKIYEYKNCSTCQKALKYLDAKKIEYVRKPIVDEPPSLAELKKMLAFIKADGGTIKNLFNTSGMQYRELKIADRMKQGLSESEALKLLSENGKLIKRPFVFSATKGVVGFKAGQWKDLK